MRRIHLFEIEDQRWCPRSLRNGLTDMLRFLSDTMGMYQPIVPRLRAALERMGTRRILDLAAGAGGPWSKLLSQLSEGASAPIEVRLTDYYPNENALEQVRRDAGNRLDFERQSVDAANVPPHLEGFRTMFTSFHHFRPDAARGILRDAVRQRRGIGIFEFTNRDWLTLLLLLPSPLFILLAAPFARPFRWSRLFWTYVVPLLPLAVTFDGLVSNLRTYTPDELREMVEELDAPDYEWDIGEAPIPHMAGRITYLIGHPRAPAVALQDAA